MNEIAARLDVRPQTVRYRLHQIEELLGDRLFDSEERLALEIALWARQLLAREEPPVHLVEEDDRLPVRGVSATDKTAARSS